MKDEKKSGANRKQPETRDEVWSDERVKSFLNISPPDGIPADYHVLLKAYRGMLPEQFERFVPFFVEAGRDINITLENGSTFLDLLSQHRRAAPYRAALEAHGARRSKD